MGPLCQPAKGLFRLDAMKRREPKGTLDCDNRCGL
jgi:hypothetical protein